MARIANSLATLRAQYNALYPQRSKKSDGWIGDAAHQARVSDHNPDANGVVKAFDLTHDPAHGVDCNAEAEKVITDSRVHYIIWNRRIRYQGGQWQPYSGTNPHTLHMHVSVTSAGADQPQEWGITKKGGTMPTDNEIVKAYEQAEQGKPSEKQLQYWRGRPWSDLARGLLEAQADTYKARLREAAMVSEDDKLGAQLLEIIRKVK